jgi:hypothetical protein
VVIEVVVKRSKINGLGIFAARDFKKEALVIKWSSCRELSKQDVKNWLKRPENISPSSAASMF